MQCDTLYMNGTIYTMDEANPHATWVAAENGRIKAVGVGQAAFLEPKKTIDLHGKVMFPGFIDSHLHGTSTGAYLKEFNVRNAESIGDVLEIVREHCRSSDDSWVQGSGLDIRRLKEKRAPLKEELDKVSGAHPVYIKNVTMHGCLLNSKAMERVNLPDALMGIVRNGRGVTTGELTSDDSAGYAAKKINELTSDAQIKEFIEAITTYCVTQGCTTICCLDGGLFEDSDRDFYIWLEAANQLPLHITPFYQTENVNRVKALGLPRIGGCLCLDGSTFEGTMAAREPYNDKAFPKGVLYWTDERLYTFLKQANKAGLQTAVHAIGDAAVDQYLRIYEKVYTELGLKGNPYHNRIEHFSLVWTEQIEKAVSMDLILSMQPIFTYLWDNSAGKDGNIYVELMDEKRARRMEPFAEILRCGGIIAGGSDGPVTLPSPLSGIHAAVNLDNPDKRISVHEAIKLFTVNGAIANWQEDLKGSIEPGKLADLVVLDGDPYSNPCEISKLKVLMTIVENKAVYINPHGA